MLYCFVFEPWSTQKRFSELVESAHRMFSQGELVTVIALIQVNQALLIQELYENEELPIDWIPAQEKTIRNRFSKINHPSRIRIEAWDSKYVPEKLHIFILSCLDQGSSVEMSKKIARDFKKKLQTIK